MFLDHSGLSGDNKQNHFTEFIILRKLYPWIQMCLLPCECVGCVWKLQQHSFQHTLRKPWHLTALVSLVDDLIAFNVFSLRTASGEKQNSHKTDGSCFNHQSALQQNSGALHPLEKLCMCSPFQRTQLQSASKCE